MIAAKHKTALQKSIFNAANLSGLAAIFLSYSIGSLLGTFIFIIAVFIGSYNKYRSVINNHYDPTTKIFLKILNDPSLTAQILMVAAFINFVKTGYDGLISPTEEFIYFITLATAWFFGFLGDDALRRNDKANFSSNILPKDQPLWIKTLIYVTRNPVFYYLITNMFFSIAILLSPQGELIEEDKAILEAINILAILTAIIGVSYSIWRGTQMIQKKISPAQTNDGVINWITVLINIEIGVMSIMQEIYWVAFAQILYIVANITCLYETRIALKKEKHF